MKQEPPTPATRAEIRSIIQGLCIKSGENCHLPLRFYLKIEPVKGPQVARYLG